MQSEIGNYQDAIMWLETNYWSSQEEMNFCEGLDTTEEESEQWLNN